MRKTILIGISALLLSGNMMAQQKMHKRNRVTSEQMTEQMVSELQLDEKQQKKISKLNEKYKTLIEGEENGRPDGQRPPQGERPNGQGGGPGGMQGGGPDGNMGGPGGMQGGGPGGGMGGPGGMSGRGPGSGMGGPGGMQGGGPGQQSSNASYDYDKKQEKYDKAISKILSDDQYCKYQGMKSQFASQRRVKEFLFGSQQQMTAPQE